jgi:hypothetical protein
VQISPYNNTGQFFNPNAYTGASQHMYSMQQGQAPLISQPLHHTMQTPVLQQPAMHHSIQYHGHTGMYTQANNSVVSYCCISVMILSFYIINFETAFTCFSRCTIFQAILRFKHRSCT